MLILIRLGSSDQTYKKEDLGQVARVKKNIENCKSVRRESQSSCFEKIAIADVLKKLPAAVLKVLRVLRASCCFEEKKNCQQLF